MVEYANTLPTPCLEYANTMPRAKEKSREWRSRVDWLVRLTTSTDTAAIDARHRANHRWHDMTAGDNLKNSNRTNPKNPKGIGIVRVFSVRDGKNGMTWLLSLE